MIAVREQFARRLIQCRAMLAAEALDQYKQEELRYHKIKFSLCYTNYTLRCEVCHASMLLAGTQGFVYSRCQLKACWHDKLRKNFAFRNTIGIDTSTSIQTFIFQYHLCIHL